MVVFGDGDVGHVTELFEEFFPLPRVQCVRVGIEHADRVVLCGLVRVVEAGYRALLKAAQEEDEYGPGHTNDEIQFCLGSGEATAVPGSLLRAHGIEADDLLVGADGRPRNEFKACRVHDERADGSRELRGVAHARNVQVRVVPSLIVDHKVVPAPDGQDSGKECDAA